MFAPLVTACCQHVFALQRQLVFAFCTWSRCLADEGEASKLKLFRIARVLKAIVQGKARQEDNTLVLSGMKWPCTESNVLFIRPCYAPLYDFVMLELDSESLGPEKLNHLVTGQPGIGKSVFGYVPPAYNRC